MEDRVLLVFGNSWDPLHTLKFQVFFTPCERDMTQHILMIFPTLHDMRSNYAQAEARNGSQVRSPSKNTKLLLELLL